MKFGLTDELIKEISAVFSDFPEVEKVVIYGSRAKGNYLPGSDIDLTLIGDDLTLETLFRIENRLDDLLLPYKFDLSLYSHIDNINLIKHINRVGKIFLDKA